MIVIQDIAPLQDRLTRDWHETDAVPGSPSRDEPDDGSSEEKFRREWLELVMQHHLANFKLWHIEDEARRPGATDAALAAVKRRIDMTNQQRNDLVEKLDQMLLGWLRERSLPNAEAPLHSETPGLIIDRLSILSLKIFHTREETKRTPAPPGHEARNRERLAILEKQRRDLAGCLEELWREIVMGKRRFELYRQLKMYNDPALNPAIYGEFETN